MNMLSTNNEDQAFSATTHGMRYRSSAPTAASDENTLAFEVPLHVLQQGLKRLGRHGLVDASQSTLLAVISSSTKKRSLANRP